MHLLTVFSHPIASSYPAAVMSAFHDPFLASGHTVDVLDLHREGFDPRFGESDHAHFWGGPPPADIAATHRRVEAADRLAFVFPVYWWSMPALLKGWIDRVFINGWAFEHSPASGLRPKLQALTTHLVPIAGDDSGAYERHGYEAAIRTQIEHGIVDYCGSRRGATAFIYESEQDSSAATLRSVDQAVRIISGAIHAHSTRA